jgi:hypothetical protein
MKRVIRNFLRKRVLEFAASAKTSLGAIYMSEPFPNGRIVFVTRVSAILVLSLWLAGCGGSSAHTDIVTPPPTPRPPAPSAELFAQHLQALKTPWPSIAFKEVRIWSNVNSARWADINTGPGSYDFSVLDAFLSKFYLNGESDVLYTIGQVPGWASTNPADLNCDFATQANTTAGGCDLPNDIAADGTGTDATFINFVTAIAQHVNDPTFLLTHAHIKYWEPWNEWYRNPVVYPNFSQTGEHTSLKATYAQMVRMTEDLRCTITGKGSVNGSPCTATAIDPTAQITTPSSGEDTVRSLSIFANFLYCNASPIQNSQCTTGTRGSAAVDVLDSHWYEPPSMGLQPETVIMDVTAYNSILSSADKAKPLWSGEGSWGEDDKYPDPDLQAAWVARYYLSGWSAGLQRMYWYAYDSPSYGQLWNGSLNPAGQAYNTLNKWILGGKLSSACSANGSVWTCNLTLSNGSAAMIIWDTSQSCSNGTCTTGAQSVPSGLANFQDLTGANSNFPSAGTVQVGIKPVLLTATATDAP